MTETTILGKHHAIATLRLEPRESPALRRLLAAAIAGFVALALLV
jgi:hypothetical protein